MHNAPVIKRTQRRTSFRRGARTEPNGANLSKISVALFFNANAYWDIPARFLYHDPTKHTPMHPFYHGKISIFSAVKALHPSLIKHTPGTGSVVLEATGFPWLYGPHLTTLKLTILFFFEGVFSLEHKPSEIELILTSQELPPTFTHFVRSSNIVH